MKYNLTLADSASVGNSSAQRIFDNKEWASVSKTNPCPHCSKPDWCYTIGELSVCKRLADPGSGWVKTSKCDREGTPYYAPISQKQIRPKSKQEFIYSDRNGQALVKVTRIDDGAGNRKFYQSHWDGKRWDNKIPDSIKPKIPIYRYAEVRKAIDAGEIIFVVEGEGVADYLWKQGLAATTFIGGALKYRSYGSYKEDIAGASLVLCPDRDELGMQHMEDVAKDFPDAKWLFAPKSDFYWSHLPKSGGLDVVDWMQQDKATVTDIMSNITEKPTLPLRRGGGSGNEPPIVELSLQDRILEIVSRGLSGSGEKLALLELSKQTNIQLKEIEAIATLLRQDLEVEEGRDDRKLEINELLAVKDNSLDLGDFLPKQLAEPLKMWCRWLNIPQAVALTAVLTAVSTLHPVGTELVIHRAMDFSVPPILFSAVVGESGQKKSPVYKTLIKKPLRVLQNEAIANYQEQLAQYERDLAEWEKNPRDEPKPTKPGLPVYFFTDATGEGIKAQAQETPHKAMFALIDELAGLFNSTNQYRKGKGSDKQDMLSYYDGLGQTVLRASGIKVDVERIYVSIFGGIQPDVLKEHTKDLKDADGHWARFLFVNQPLAASQLPDDGADINLKELLAGCYRRIASLPLQQYTLSSPAFKRYQSVYNELEQMRVNHPQPGMRAVYSKMEGCIGRLALNLHAVSMAVNGGNVTEISLETMNRAIALAEFYIGQVKMLHAESKADIGELPAVLTKLLKIAVDKGKLTARDAVRSLNVIKTNTQALDAFKELKAMGYGVVEKIKASWIFRPLQTSVNDFIDSGNRLIDTFKQPNSNIFSSCVNAVNGVNDFLEKPSETLFTGLIDPNVNESVNATLDKKILENIDSTDTIDTTTEDLAATSFSTVNDTIDNTIDTTALKPLGFSLKKGDGVECYPTLTHAQNHWKVKATVIEVESEQGWFLGCTVEYRDRKKGTVRDRIAGGCSDWILRKSC